MISINYKICSKCGTLYNNPEKYFNKDKKNPDGLFNYCIICRNVDTKHRRELNICKEKIKKDYKVCSQCKIEYHATNEYFYIKSDTVDGLNYRCKQCESLHKKEKNGTLNKPKAKEGYKICTKCKNEILATEEYFGKHKSYKDGFSL